MTAIWVLAILGINIVFYEGSANGGLAHEKCVEARDVLSAWLNTEAVCYPVERIDG